VLQPLQVGSDRDRHRGERLTGCLTCNLWASVDSKRWKRLSEADVRALHIALSHEDQAKRLYGLAEMEREALDVLRLVIRQTSAAKILTPNLLNERERSLTVTTAPRLRGHEAPDVIAFRRD
jgi:hypothetical protein